jgi:hypothetical protein
MLKHSEILLTRITFSFIILLFSIFSVRFIYIFRMISIYLHTTNFLQFLGWDNLEKLPRAMELKYPFL